MTPVAPDSGEAPPSSRRGVLKSVIGAVLGLGVAVVAALLLGISGPALLDALKSARPGPLLAVVAGGFVLLAFQALRWWVVMRPVLPLRYGLAYAAMLVGSAFNVLVPARGGDFLRVQYLGRRTGVSRATLLGTELVDFWSDKVGWVVSFPLVCAFAWIVRHEAPPRWLYNALGVMGALAGFAGLFLKVGGSPRLARRFPRLSPGPEWLQNLRTGVAVHAWRRLAFVQLVLAPLPWLWETAVIVASARALGLDLTAMQAFATLTAFNIGTVVPSPASAGSFEAAGTFALVSFGVPHDRALAFLVLYHACLVLPTVVGGMTLLAAQGESLFGKSGRAGRKGRLHPAPNEG